MSFSTPPNEPTIPLRPFTLSVPQADVDELRSLLKSSRLTKRTYENTTQEVYLGVKRDWVEEATRYWLEEYDWCVRRVQLRLGPPDLVCSYTTALPPANRLPGRSSKIT